MPIKKVCVIGLGYIGLPTAAMFATHGLQVVGVDINDRIIATLLKGSIHIHEPGLQSLVKEAFSTGNLTVVSKPVSADAFIIAVPTPFNPDKTADMRAVTSATTSILPHLRKGSLVVLESTSPPRTTAQLILPILESSGLVAGQDFFVCYSPERVLPGHILTELVQNARVIGGIDPASAEAGRRLYATFVKGEIVLTDATTAEMVKLMENTYRDINIAIANEFSRMADRFGIDVREAIQVANRHPRVKILEPGPGVGGHCISVDPWFLVEAAPDLANLIRTARQVNDAQPAYVVELLRRAVGELAGKRITVLGLSYKPDVDDLRESPAVEVAHLLHQAGAEVTVYEPFKPDAVFEGLVSAPTLAAALQDSEILVLSVKHTAFCQLDPAEVRKLTAATVILDTVNGFTSPAWEEAGFTVYHLGKSF